MFIYLLSYSYVIERYLKGGGPMYLISGSFNWVGFHFVQKLLETGNEVVGVDCLDTEKKENLSMYIGRNSLFTHIDNIGDLLLRNKQDFKAIFLINHDLEEESLISLTRDNIFNFYHGKQETTYSDRVIQVELPLLYGEWMPRNEEGFYQKEEFFRFDSKQLEEEAIYIEDFVQSFLQIISSSNVPNHIKMEPLKKKRDREDCEDEIIFVRETQPIKNRLEILDEHYQTFKKLY